VAEATSIFLAEFSSLKAAAPSDLHTESTPYWVHTQGLKPALILPHLRHD